MIGSEDSPEAGLPKGREAASEKGSHSANIKHEITSISLTEPVCTYTVYPAIAEFHELCKSVRNDLLGGPEKFLELFH